LFAAVEYGRTAFLGHAIHLQCGPVSNKTVSWMHSSLENTVVFNATIEGDGRFFFDNSALVIREVKASDAGIYLCGEDTDIYHKIRLAVYCK